MDFTGDDVGRFNIGLGVGEVFLNELIHREPFLFGLAQVVISQFLLLALNHSLELLLEVPGHTWDAFENESALLGVLRDGHFWGQQLKLLYVEVLSLDGCLTNHVFDLGAEGEVLFTLLNLLCKFFLHLFLVLLYPLLVFLVHVLATGRGYRTRHRL